ncbi:MAG: 50S ribosomal protein L10 [Chloroflexota bacterium]
MAITKEKKTELLSTYAENIEGSSAIFLTTYQGIGVNDLTELRKKLREVESNFRVVKNTLAKRALDEAGLDKEEVVDLLSGAVGFSFCQGDPPPVAKALVDFSKDFEEFEIKGGLLGDVFVNKEGVENLADLPPMEVIRAQMLGVISAPATQLAGVISGGVRQVVNVLDAYSKSEDSEDSDE